jgi:hypothetical protein
MFFDFGQLSDGYLVFDVAKSGAKALDLKYFSYSYDKPNKWYSF